MQFSESQTLTRKYGAHLVNHQLGQEKTITEYSKEARSTTVQTLIEVFGFEVQSFFVEARTPNSSIIIIRHS